MNGGYVLDFSNVTYAAFFRDYGIDIYNQCYQMYGNSKAKLMRGYWQVANDSQIGQVLDGLYRYITDTNPVNCGGPVEEKHVAIVDRLLNRKPKRENAPVHTEEDFLDIEFGKLDLSRLSLGAGISETIEQRFKEIQQCLKADASLAVIFLCGSTLEGLLLNAATQCPQQFNTAKASPEKDGKVKQFHDWSLNDFINVAHEIGIIGLDVKKFSHALRDFRNYIHPFEQASQQFKPDHHTAKISWQVLKAAVANLTGTRTK
jgi:hypothetical protein